MNNTYKNFQITFVFRNMVYVDVSGTLVLVDKGPESNRKLVFTWSNY